MGWSLHVYLRSESSYLPESKILNSHREEETSKERMQYFVSIPLYCRREQPHYLQWCKHKLIF